MRPSPVARTAHQSHGRSIVEVELTLGTQCLCRSDALRARGTGVVRAREEDVLARTAHVHAVESVDTNGGPRRGVLAKPAHDECVAPRGLVLAFIDAVEPATN